MAREPNICNSPFAVCQRLTGPDLGRGYCLFVDNYSRAPALCDLLAANNTMCVGTVRQNRCHLPKDLMDQSLQTGQMDYRRPNQVLAIKWKDKREGQILRTKHLPNMREDATRTERKSKPDAVGDYTTHMPGIDFSDQIVSYNPFHHKTVE
ncbi:PiggyBac transposable element-derived protein 4 [Plakobranchus ocellatus]|uniref:PiggyBac transposable element-derived protein 4 n=1 Tax=Plakobranchus ocellatus TaxID=259542 RepID=A0AAV3YDL1_9GAST|nr:PiggyBac transposable element-derived protein 4 [Plakobranchus ocellatus]